MEKHVDDPESVSADQLERDLRLRGYESAELSGLLQTAVLLIPGPITPFDSDNPIQKLTTHLAFISKDLAQNNVQNRVVLQKDVDKHYVEERYAHVDLGALVVSLQQLGGLANLVQILDFLLNLIQLRFTMRRTQELTPNVKFDLHIRNGDRVVKWHIEGPANELTKMTTPQRLNAVVEVLRDVPSDDD
jgi:hypothetical protein